jgi:hypothetical protein
MRIVQVLLVGHGAFFECRIERPSDFGVQFRTFYPLMSLHSPVEFSEIVNNYLDSYLKRGWMPECR